MKTIDLAPFPSFLERQRLPIQPRPETDLGDQAEHEPSASSRAVLGVIVLLLLAAALLALAMVGAKAAK